MTGLPTLLVKLDDGSGSFPYDVSAFVRLPGGMSITRGRTDEFNQVQPSTLSIVFDNTTGVFTLGSGTYGIAIDQRIQVTETVSGAVKRFTGYVQDWPVAWPDGSDTFAVATVTAVDRLSRLARRKLSMMAAQECRVDGPLALFLLDEPEGATTAGDTSGNGVAALVSTGLGAAPAFGTALTGVVDSNITGALFAGGQYLATSFSGLPATPAIEVAFSRSGAPASTEYMVHVNTANAFIGMDSTGHITAGYPLTAVITSANTYIDGLVHVATLSLGATSELFVDGVSVGTTSGAVFSAGGVTLAVGANDGGVSASGIFNGTLAFVGVYTSLTSTRAAAHANAIRNGFPTDTADQRIARLASYANIPTADQSLEVGKQASIAAQSTTGQSVLDAIQTVSTAEGGLVFIQGDGKLVMQNKDHRVLKAIGTAALTLTADQIDPDVAPGGAKNYLFNTATGAREGGAAQRSVNTAGVTANEEYPVDLSNALLPSDDLVLNILQWTTGKYGTPRPRIPSLTIDLLTTASAVTAQAVLALEIGDLITITGLPSQTPASLGSLLVEGWTENLTHDSWSITLNTIPSALFLAPVVDTAGATCDTGYAVYF